MCPLCETCETWNISEICPMAKVREGCLGVNADRAQTLLPKGAQLDAVRNPYLWGFPCTDAHKAMCWSSLRWRCSELWGGDWSADCRGAPGCSSPSISQQEAL